MGMDVYGRNPSDPVGEYFRATVWSWQPIHHLCVELCSDLLSKKTLKGMMFNDQAAGPSDQATCTQIASRFDLWLEHNAGGLTLESEAKVTPDGCFVTDEELADNSCLETKSPYTVDDDHLKEWVEFLRHCGGFEVQ
jgi:hypothetical protein